MANTPFKMKGFGGFGNSPVTKKTKVDDTDVLYTGGSKGKISTTRHIKKTSEKNPADYKRTVYQTKQRKVQKPGSTNYLNVKPGAGEITDVYVTRTKAKGTGTEAMDNRKIKTKTVEYNVGDSGDITKTVTKSKRKGTIHTSQTKTKSKKIKSGIGKYFAKKRMKRITKKATKNV